MQPTRVRARVIGLSGNCCKVAGGPRWNAECRRPDALKALNYSNSTLIISVGDVVSVDAVTLSGVEKDVSRNPASRIMHIRLSHEQEPLYSHGAGVFDGNPGWLASLGFQGKVTAMLPPGPREPKFPRPVISSLAAGVARRSTAIHHQQSHRLACCPRQDASRQMKSTHDMHTHTIMCSLLRPRQDDPLDTPPPPLDDNPDNDDHHNYGWEWFLVALFIIIVLVLVAWFLYSRLRARRLGLAPPSLNPFSDRNRIPSRNYPATGGLVGWAKGKWRGFRSGRHVATGSGYEGSGRRGAQRAQFGALDPDEAWDARVGHEADEYGAYSGYEEQELGLASAHGRGESRGYGPAGGVGDITRGRSPSRELDERYDEAMHGGGGSHANPFGDAAERSDLRGVSPRPHDEPPAYSGQRSDDGPGERRSAFRENV
ncbi:hypothetical protein FH972_021760 [Carpinus fangiana]|uniref:Uncharacterized protein n=1 Tax=Carpinus fangiana TaxID=176857 RepID=A0A5N6KQ86_9ROSI|nr:hypothetical protein FH972_021760 [Carpinus fangiana]